MQLNSLCDIGFKLFQDITSLNKIANKISDHCFRVCAGQINMSKKIHQI